MKMLMGLASNHMNLPFILQSNIHSGSYMSQSSCTENTEASRRFTERFWSLHLGMKHACTDTFSASSVQLRGFSVGLRVSAESGNVGH